MPKIQQTNKIKGTRDVMPDESLYWNYALNVTEEVVLSAGVDKIETPILEKFEIYEKIFKDENESILNSIYSFEPAKSDGSKKKKGSKEEGTFSLRPEIIPGIARMYIENNMQSWTKPLSLYTIGKCFKNDNSQTGRNKEFNQMAVEIIGEEDPMIDANIISLAWDITRKLKIDDAEIHINSMGCPDCRPKIKKSLNEYFKKKQSKLCDDCKKKMKKNTIGILACKNEKCQNTIASAPLSIDNICDDCKKNFMSVLEYLDEMGVIYNLAPNLVRENDYHNKTVFEISIGQERKHTLLGGGGRHDHLIERLGGEQTPAIGLEINIDLLAEYIKSNNIKIPKNKSKVNVFIIQLGESAKKIAIKKAKELRKLGISTGIAIGKDTIKAQLKSAEKVNALFSIIIGQREAVTNTSLVRDMRDGVQETIELDDLNVRIFNMVEERIKEETEYTKKMRMKK
uniref:Histidine--tRNA ligase n=1 Tax=candidate division CPR3 bacterium TaxID=2268181 RepID=A0A7C4M1G4_UNCC3